MGHAMTSPATPDRVQPWHLTNRFDPRGCLLADRHYTRQTVGSNQFMPSGEALVLITEAGDAVWGSSWQIAKDGTLMAVHDWPRAWICSIFRNESTTLSSDLVRAAVAATRHCWGTPPEQGFVSFVDADKVRHKRDPGRCYLKAGWKRVGETKSGKVALQLPPEDFPNPDPPLGGSWRLMDLPERRPYTGQRKHIGGPVAATRS